MRLHRHYLGRVVLLVAAAAFSSATASEALAQGENWSFEAGLLWMQHGKSNSVPMLQKTTGVDSLNANDHSFEFDTGYEFAGMVPIEENLRLQARYNRNSWLSQYDAGVTVDSVIVPNAFVMTQVPTLPVAPIASFVSSYQSELQTAEILLSTQVSKTSNSMTNVSAGFRWAGLDETFSTGLNTVGPNALGLVGVKQDVSNQLWGLQMGVDGNYDYDDEWGVDYFANIGVLGNKIDTYNGTVFFNGDPTIAAASSSTQTAFLGELGLGVNHRIDTAVWLRAGYRMMWLDGVALAPDQLSRTSSWNMWPAGTSVDTGTLFVHGADLSIIVAY